MSTIDRRSFLAAGVAGAARAGAAREYHLSISPDALEVDHDLPGLVRQAGVTDVWIAGYLYGHWYYTPERIEGWLQKLRRMGLNAHGVNVPLGHPGDSLGAVAGQPPLTPPPHWKQAVRADGGRHWGTSLHAPATEENSTALRRLATAGVRAVFLDDDFRLARGPGEIGGCFCAAHVEDFRRKHGYAESCREDLTEAIRSRTLTPLVRAWTAYHCDLLTASFRAMQAAAPAVSLGIMVMYLGSEKAGIRLADYRDVPFRVGELMFEDRSFDKVKGKTDELFSALFHRRYARADLCYSETTAFPANRLSAANMAAKLAISTLGDVRKTMFMSGLTAFPRTHWETLGPAMRRHAAVHARVAGHRPRGPFKHYWGEASRLVGADQPYSLFLACGVPFEVCDEPPGTGWTFLSDADAAALGAKPGRVSRRETPESLEDLFALKARLREQLSGVPYVEDEKPVVCSWLPTARTALLWNLSGRREAFSLRHGERKRVVEVEALDLAEVREL